jgi:hypothetical protein
MCWLFARSKHPIPDWLSAERSSDGFVWAGPVVMSTLLSCALWHLGLYRFTEAAHIVGLDWLLHFGCWLPDLGHLPDMSFASAIIQWTITTFIAAEQHFSSGL